MSRSPVPTELQNDQQDKKRRRVQRACDECRKKKIKCDGRMPCTHCTIYSYQCTFDQPSNRRRNPAAGYVELLEAKCERYKKLLQKLLPDVEIEEAYDGPSEDDAQRQDATDSNRLSDAPVDDTRAIQSMLMTIELNRDDRGDVDFRGHSSGTVFVKSVCGQLGVSPSGENKPSHDIYGGAPYAERSSFATSSRLKDSPPVSAQELSRAANRKHSISPTEHQDEDEEIPLPNYELALQLSYMCFNNACVIIQFVHQPSYFSRLANLYDVKQEGDTDDFLSVVYSVIAVGTLFSGMVEGKFGITDPRLRAFQYYQASRRLFEPLDRANSEILQSLLCQVLFLQSTANMSTCWTYMGAALRCAQRMGMHRKLDDSFSPLDRQLRRKQFWAIRNVELYLAAVLGLPSAMNVQDFDQTFPEEVDDDYVTESAIGSQPVGVVSSMQSVNAYSRLMTIMQEIIRQIYPLESPHLGSQRDPICHATLEKLQKSLDEWSSGLPETLRPDFEYHDSSQAVYRQSRLLRFTYYHAYILLYRPFLHYLRVDSPQTREFRIYALRAKDGALGVLRLTEDIFANMPACFGHWFSIYAAFFAGTILAYSVLQEKPVNSDREECIKYIDVAKMAMEFCSCNYSAERCSAILEEVTKQIASDHVDPGTSSSIVKLENASTFSQKSKIVRKSVESHQQESAKRSSGRRASTAKGKSRSTTKSSSRTNGSLESTLIARRNRNVGTTYTEPDVTDQKMRQQLDLTDLQGGHTANLGHSQLPKDASTQSQFLHQPWHLHPQTNHSVHDTYQPLMPSEHYGYPFENYSSVPYYPANGFASNSRLDAFADYDANLADLSNSNWAYVHPNVMQSGLDSNALQYDVGDMPAQMFGINDGTETQNVYYQ